jgi:hypothetical protein
MCWATFFFPGFHPVLDGGVRDERPIFPPEMPTEGAEWQAVLTTSRTASAMTRRV